MYLSNLTISLKIQRRAQNFILTRTTITVAALALTKVCVSKREPTTKNWGRMCRETQTVDGGAVQVLIVRMQVID